MKKLFYLEFDDVFNNVIMETCFLTRVECYEFFAKIDCFDCVHVYLMYALLNEQGDIIDIKQEKVLK